MTCAGFCLGWHSLSFQEVAMNIHHHNRKMLCYLSILHQFYCVSRIQEELLYLLCLLITWPFEYCFLIHQVLRLLSWLTKTSGLVLKFVTFRNNWFCTFPTFLDCFGEKVSPPPPTDPHWKSLLSSTIAPNATKNDSK